jgi:hypothetical protein
MYTSCSIFTVQLLLVQMLLLFQLLDVAVSILG